ncbi:hypothetical protein ARMGADRAFT_987149 [Armillaria gallica]|uniref:DNA repair protein RAD50 n=1 Tax=Armillaria gallica TaxID=47427 RepID=A0A2H3DQE5_ARMGA|nr:hypothetical protein ARMGADRAFT_987149 [Armillaria gallica]
MAALNKLAIRGIRSFDDKQISVIEFFTPVTVIVGHNGSGKTTIIECLKYATTGDQPPNTRGGAFVHDPKMANEKEVKAQVKLRFVSASGTRMLAVRNLSVTAKKTSGLTMKTLEGILALADSNVEKGSKRGVISTKCAELDTEIPQLLGVSKAVLENVIFCHQEDSYWPLAEPSTLKKKFDDIFEATRQVYTKALDSIKTLRKERVADLKAEKEHLEGLRREKGHADKLRKTISDLNSTIASKEIEYDETKKSYDEIVVANAKFYEYSLKFREVFSEAESSTKNKAVLEEQLQDAKMNLQSELPGSEEDLKQERNNLSSQIEAQKQKRDREQNNLHDLEDDVANKRKEHTKLASERGQLIAEAESQKQRIADREQLIFEISDKHGIKGFSHSPLQGSDIQAFISRLSDLQRSHKAAVNKLKTELAEKRDEYTKQHMQLTSQAEQHKATRTSLQEQIAERRKKIKEDEKFLDSSENYEIELSTMKDNIEDKKRRLEKLKKSLNDADYDGQLAEKATQAQGLEYQRETLGGELTSLSNQAEARVALDLKRGEVKSKTVDMTHAIDNINEKYRALTKKNVNTDTIGTDVDRLLVEKEAECAELEAKANSANQTLQHAEATLSNLQTQLEKKEAELKRVEKILAENLDHPLEKAIADVNGELRFRNSQVGSYQVYESLLNIGKETQRCSVCDRHMDAKVFAVFETFLKAQMTKSADVSIEHEHDQIKEWQGELERLQALMPIENNKKQLKMKDIPALQDDIEKEEDKVAEATTKAEKADQELAAVKKQIKDIQGLQITSRNVSRLQKEIQRAEEEVESYEKELAATGSTKTMRDVQNELDEISTKIHALDREKSQIMKEKDRQNNLYRAIEGDVHKMEKDEWDLQNKIKEREDTRKRVESMKESIDTFNKRVKDADAQLAEAQGPIDALEADFKITEQALNAQITEAQSNVQASNQSNDRLESIHKDVERYVMQRRAQKLAENERRSEQADLEIKECMDSLQKCRESITQFDREIGGGDAKRANLQENIRIRQLARQVKDIEDKIAGLDLEAAARARRNFEEKYGPEKEKEQKLQASYSHIAGELSSLRAQLKQSEKDMKEFKEIDTRYTDQLVKVKMSDVANNDLELYAKALDNAIMKYHGLKMEEVNDTMRHLWNRTYQGTDIDGIKIRSDVEGGASKRSYNYRVVMTKDQVEMDMRGRCSAGQKMLASIIIRLALSDSFGQNCGILALDEPTNALDRENIDALADSLVDIINERKHQSNFQLIIITHDETFLAKLGQNNIMQHYWRVSRDARQKSIIERQNFSTS